MIDLLLALARSRSQERAFFPFLVPVDAPEQSWSCDGRCEWSNRQPASWLVRVDVELESRRGLSCALAATCEPIWLADVERSPALVGQCSKLHGAKKLQGMYRRPQILHLNTCVRRVHVGSGCVYASDQISTVQSLLTSKGIAAASWQRLERTTANGIGSEPLALPDPPKTCWSWSGG